MRRVVEPLLSGTETRTFGDRDLEYVRDLGPARVDKREGHLVIVDRDGGRSWDEKIFHRRESGGGAEIDVIAERLDQTAAYIDRRAGRWDVATKGRLLNR